MEPKLVRTVLSDQKKAMLCATQLLLDDCYIALKEAVPTLSRIIFTDA
jgi:hypothetical protein